MGMPLCVMVQNGSLSEALRNDPPDPDLNPYPGESIVQLACFFLCPQITGCMTSWDGTIEHSRVVRPRTNQGHGHGCVDIHPPEGESFGAPTDLGKMEHCTSRK